MKLVISLGEARLFVAVTVGALRKNYEFLSILRRLFFKKTDPIVEKKAVVMQKHG